MPPPADALALRKLAGARLLSNADRAVETAVLSVMDRWLSACRFAILNELSNVSGLALTAAANRQSHRHKAKSGPSRHAHLGRTTNPGAAVDAAVSAANEWVRGADAVLLPTIEVAFGEAYNHVRKTADFSPYRAQQDYMATVSDRLRIWPEGTFEELRPELLEALAEAETMDDITDRLAYTLGLNPDMRWKAHRIARTEAHGAIVGGKLAAARSRAEWTQETLFKQWLSTDDERVRTTHRVADGQIVGIDGMFRVGGYLIPFPAAPITIAPHETINCRCDVLLLDPQEVQDELQGKRGSAGVIRPGGARMGPDEPDAADVAIASLAEQMDRPTPARRRGEDDGQVVDPDATPAVDTDQVADPKGRPELADLSDDDLTVYLFDHDTDDEMVAAVQQEIDRRMARYAAEFDDSLVDLEHVGEDLDPEHDHPDPEPTPEQSAQSIDELWGADPLAAPAPPTEAQLAEYAFSDAMANGAPDAEIERLADAFDRAVAKETREQQRELAKQIEFEEQARAIGELMDGGMDEEEAVGQVTGATPEQQRIQRFTMEMASQGITGRGFDDLVGQYHKRLVWELADQVEQEVRGQIFKARYRDNPPDVIGHLTDFWFVNEATARKYMSEELADWFDRNGRLTRADLKQSILDGGGNAYGPRGGDFHQ